MLRSLFGRSEAIDVEEAARRLDAGEIVLADVREAAEWRGGHPRGARHHPLSSIPTGGDALRAHAKPIAFICRSGHRSSIACAAARRQGIEAIDVRGGMGAWNRAGLPIAKG